MLTALQLPPWSDRTGRTDRPTIAELDDTPDHGALRAQVTEQVARIDAGIHARPWRPTWAGPTAKETPQ